MFLFLGRYSPKHRAFFALIGLASIVISIIMSSSSPVWAAAAAEVSPVRQFKLLNEEMRRSLEKYSQIDSQLASIVAHRAAVPRELQRFGLEGLYDRGSECRGIKIREFIKNILHEHQQAIQTTLPYDLLFNPQYRSLGLLCDVVKREKIDDIFATMGILPQRETAESRLVASFTSWLQESGYLYYNNLPGESGHQFIGICLPARFHTEKGWRPTSFLLVALDANPSVNEYIQDAHLTYYPFSSPAAVAAAPPAATATTVAIEDVLSEEDIPRCINEEELQASPNFCLMKEIVSRSTEILIDRSRQQSLRGQTHGMLIKYKVLLEDLKKALLWLKNETSPTSLQYDPSTFFMLYGWIFDLTSGILTVSVPQLYEESDLLTIVQNNFRQRFANHLELLPKHSYLMDSGMHALHTAIRVYENTYGKNPVALILGEDIRKNFAQSTASGGMGSETIEESVYFELAPFLDITTVSTSGITGGSDSGGDKSDAFVVGLSANNSVNGDKLNDVWATIRNCISNKTSSGAEAAGFCTLIIDDTVEIPGTDPINPIDKLLISLKPEIAQGKLNVVITKSLQKFTSLGTGKMKSGLISFINNGDPKFEMDPSYHQNVVLKSGKRDFVTEQISMHLLNTNLSTSFGTGISNNLRLTQYAIDNSKLVAQMYTNLNAGVFAPLANGPFLFYYNDPAQWGMLFSNGPSELEISVSESFGFLTSSELKLPGEVMRVSLGIETPFTIYQKFYSNALLASALKSINDQHKTYRELRQSIFFSDILGRIESECQRLQANTEDPYVTAKKLSIVKNIFIIVDKFSTIIPQCIRAHSQADTHEVSALAQQQSEQACANFFGELLQRSKRIFEACKIPDQQESSAGARTVLPMPVDAQAYYLGMEKISQIVDQHIQTLDLSELYRQIQEATKDRWSVQNNYRIRLAEEGSASMDSVALSYEEVEHTPWILSPFFNNIHSDLTQRLNFVDPFTMMQSLFSNPNRSVPFRP
ncbi:MAG: hypothetical protein HQK53_14335 [Oligoflexia bacterium]|nr:hypothetical protein [Oligoflexia bacterium]